MKKLLLSLFVVSFLVGCATTSNLSDQPNLTGIVKEDFFGNRTYDLKSESINITGSIKKSFLANYIPEIRLGASELTGKVFVVMNTNIELFYNGQLISGKIKNIFAKEIIDLNDGDIKITGEMSDFFGKKKYLIDSEEIKVTGDIAKTLTGFKVNLLVNNGSIMGEIKEGLAKQTYSLRIRDVDDYGLLAFIIIDILRYKEFDAERKEELDKINKPKSGIHGPQLDDFGMPRY